MSKCLEVSEHGWWGCQGWYGNAKGEEINCESWREYHETARFWHRNCIFEIWSPISCGTSYGRSDLHLNAVCICQQIATLQVPKSV